MTQITRLTLEEDGGPGRMRLKETKTDLEAPLETVGQDLRSARLKRGDDLETVSGVLKIRKEHLEALEEDKMELLPGRTYAVGFIRSYATYLGLKPAEYVDRFKAEIAGRNEMAPPPVEVIDEEDRKRLPQGWWAIAGVVLLLVLYGAYQLMAASDRAMREQVNDPPSADETMTPPKAVKIQPRAPQPQQAAQTNPQDTNAGLTQNTSGNGTPALGAAQNGQPAQPSSVPQPLPQQGHLYGAMNQNPRVLLRAWLPTRVLVTDPSGKIYIMKVLNAGDIYQVPNLPNLRMTVANASALEIVLDGQSVGRVGRGPDPAESVSLDPQAIAGRNRR